MHFYPAFLAIWLVFVGYWIAYWGGNKKTVYQTNPALRIVFAVGLFVLLFDGKILPNSFHRVLLPHTQAVEWTGLLLCAGGVALAIWARRILGRNWSANPELKEEHELIEAGPYRLVRHPIYTGILLAILGSSLGGGRINDLAALLFCVVTFYLKLKVEESLMLRQFPQAYPEYMKRTKALVPYLL